MGDHDLDQISVPGQAAAKRPDYMALMSPQEQRAIAMIKVKAQLALMRPRNEAECLNEIKILCQRRELAEQSMYEYPRAGTKITGPSIRLAEALAGKWEHIYYGWFPVNVDDDRTDIEAFAWDLQKNVSNVRGCSIFNRRKTKAGFQELTDPRDVYENMASQAQRRLRACILEIIPGDVVDKAVKWCEETLKKSGSGKPLKDRIAEMYSKFTELGVTREMLEKNMGHPIEACSELDLISMGKIYNSLKDNYGKREDYFDLKAGSEAPQTMTPQETPQAKTAQTPPPPVQPVETETDEDAADVEDEPKRRGRKPKSGDTEIRKDGDTEGGDVENLFNQGETHP